jgi:hypothetical protein
VRTTDAADPREYYSGEVRMAIKGGNPLFTLDATANGKGFIGKIVLPATGETIEQEIGRDHPLYDDFAMFGWETKTRNTIGAVAADKRTAETARDRAMAITDAYDNGDWKLKGEAGEAAPTGGYVAQAIAAVLGKPVQDVVAYVKGLVADIQDEKKRAAALRAAWDDLEVEDPRITAKVKELKDEAYAARLAKKAAAPKRSLLAGLTA